MMKDIIDIVRSDNIVLLFIIFIILFCFLAINVLQEMERSKLEKRIHNIERHLNYPYKVTRLDTLRYNGELSDSGYYDIIYGRSLWYETIDTMSNGYIIKTIHKGLRGEK